MLILIGFVVGCFSVSLENILLVYSDATPSALIKLFESYENTLKIGADFLMSKYEPAGDINLIIDISLDSGLFWLLNSISELYQVNYFTLTRSISSNKSKFRYQVHTPLDHESKLLFNLINYLNWPKFTILASNSQVSSEISNNLPISIPISQVNSIIYDKNLTYPQITNQVKQFIKIPGVKNLLILDQGPSLQKFVKSINELRISTYGTYFLFGSQSVHLVNIPGALILTDPGTEYSESWESYEFEALKNLMSQFNVFSPNEFESICPGQVCRPGMNIVNIGNGEVKIVGSVSSQIKITEQIVFPGNNTSINAERINTKLILSIANGTSEPYNAFKSFIASNSYQGAIYAVSKSNKLKDIENFEFELNPTDCGNLIFDFSWYSNCLLSQRTKLGLAYLTGFFIFGAYGNLVSLRALGIAIPQISPYGISVLIDDSSLYPEFFRLATRLDDYLYNSVLLYLNFHWKDFIIFTSDQPGYYSLYQQFILNMQEIGARYLNPEALRILPSNYTYLDFNKYKSYFQFAKDSKCRLIQILCNNPGDVIEGLYDIGLRKGDRIIMGNWEIFYIIYDQIPETRLNKRKELMEGALMTSLYEFQGDIGKTVESEVSELHSDVKSMCVSYDSFSLVKNAIQHLMLIGEDFEDTAMLSKAIRTQKFVGCSGDVYFSDGSNSRASSITAIDQIVYNTTLKRLTMVTLALANKFSIITMKYVRKPFWPSGISQFPSNYIETSKCGFSENKRQKSSAGRTQVLIVSAVYLSVTCIAAIISYRTFDTKVELMSKRVQASFSDNAFLLYFFIEFFQIITLEPKNGILAKNLNKIQFLIGLNLISFFGLEFEDFWRFYLVLLSFCTGFVVICAIIFVIRKQFFKEIWVFVVFQNMAENLLPIIGHIGFFPIVSQLLMIFDCWEGTGSSLLESFLQEDCSEYCYKGKHKEYVIPASILILFLLFTITYFRPFWELSQLNLNLKTRPVYLCLLSIFQVLIIVIYKNIRSFSEAAAGFSISAVLLAFIVVTAKLKPYNYERAAVYQIVSLTIGLWVVMVSSFSLVFDLEPIFVACMYGGVGVLSAFGFFISFKYPKRFSSDEVGLIPILIKFQFAKRVDNIITKSKYFARFSGIMMPEFSTHNVS